MGDCWVPKKGASLRLLGAKKRASLRLLGAEKKGFSPPLRLLTECAGAGRGIQTPLVVVVVVAAAFN